nr:MAG TPA: hypothetical protein [Caudoviricetes sp.]
MRSCHTELFRRCTALLIDLRLVRRERTVLIQILGYYNGIEQRKNRKG